MDFNDLDISFWNALADEVDLDDHLFQVQHIKELQAIVVTFNTLLQSSLYHRVLQPAKLFVTSGKVLLRIMQESGFPKDTLLESPSIYSLPQGADFQIWLSDKANASLAYTQQSDFDSTQNRLSKLLHFVVRCQNCFHQLRVVPLHDAYFTPELQLKRELLEEHLIDQYNCVKCGASTEILLEME